MTHCSIIVSTVDCRETFNHRLCKMEGVFCVIGLLLGGLLTKGEALHPSIYWKEGEYCTGDDMELQCAKGEVILMDKALFGRMKIGKCVKSDLGFLGCHTDVTRKMDSLCSGKQICKMQTITKRNFEDVQPTGRDCRDGLELNLRVKYTCVVELNTADLCSRGNRIVSLQTQIGHISSDAIESKSCQEDSRSSTIAFKVATSQGQQINITMIDFEPDPSKTWGSCVNYGRIVELKTMQQTTICGGLERHKWLMVSNSNQIEIRLQKHQNKKFMLQFQVLGCADIQAPVGGWIKKDGQKLTVSCHKSNQIWTLDCRGSRWDGVIGNCTSVAPKSAQSIQGTSYAFSISSDVWLALIIACCVIVCVSVLTFGIVYWRRRTLQAEIAKMKSNPGKVVLPKGKNKDESEYMFPSMRPRSNFSETEDAVYDFCFSPGPGMPNNMTSSVTLPCRGNANLQYNNPVNVSGAPESPKYKTLVFIKQ